jgi:hypothetical protein
MQPFARDVVRQLVWHQTALFLVRLHDELSDRSVLVRELNEVDRAPVHSNHPNHALLVHCKLLVRLERCHERDRVAHREVCVRLKTPAFHVRALQGLVEAERGGHAGVGLFEADHFAAISDTVLDTEGQHFVQRNLD